MPDQRRRELERSSELDDAARHLIEGRRVGELTNASLGLAAYLGHPPAILALEGRRVIGEEPLIDTATAYGSLVQNSGLRSRRPRLKQILFFRGLIRWGFEALTRALIAHERASRESPGPHEAAFWHAVDTWLAHPGAEAALLADDRRQRIPTDARIGMASIPFFSAAEEQGDRAPHRRAALLKTIESALSRKRQPVALSALRSELLPWAMSREGGASLTTPADADLPEGPGYRQRVIARATSAARLRIAEVIARTWRVRLKDASGNSFDFELLDFGIERCVGFKTDWPAAGILPLDAIVDARPLPGPDR